MGFTEAAGALANAYLPQELHIPAYFCGFNILWTYIAAEATGNASQVDRVWTFLPPIYGMYYAVLPLLDSAPNGVKAQGLNHRIILVAVLQWVWMTRLSFNTYRRGLYSLTEEDYRWAHLRKVLPGFLFKILNAVFIATIQNLLLLAIGAYPSYLLLSQERTTLSTTDMVLGVLALIDSAIEFTADNQQYSFQTFKRSKPRKLKPTKEEWPGARIRWTEEDEARGYVSKGLWAWSRHPNFLAEQTFWWILCLFPFLSGPYSIRPLFLDETYTSLANIKSALLGLHPFFPAMALSCLFIGSTLFSESISLKNYPVTYKAYQRRVSMFLPWDTVIKGFMLTLVREREEVDRLVWGNPGKNPNATGAIAKGKGKGKVE